MKTLRVGVFETNSSSQHEICFPCASAYANLHVDPCTVTAHGEGSYDWGYEVLEEPEQLIDYWLVAIKMNGNWVKNDNGFHRRVGACPYRHDVTIAASVGVSPRPTFIILRGGSIPWLIRKFPSVPSPAV